MKLIKTGWTTVKGLWSNESGQGLVEYALIVAMVSIGCMIALGLLGVEVGDVFKYIVKTLNG